LQILQIQRQLEMAHLASLLKVNEHTVTILDPAAGKEIYCLALTKRFKIKLEASL